MLADFRANLQGLIAFAPTPFMADGSVDLDGLAAIVSRLARTGDAVVVCGGVGEYASLDDDEWRDIVRVAVGAAGHQAPVIAGIGRGTRAAAVLAEAAARSGATGILVCPFAHIEPTADGLAVHYRQLADASGLGLIIYSTTAQPVTLDQLLRLAEIDGVAGFKEKAGDIRLFAAAREQIGARWVWINGNAELWAAEYAVAGADAFTTGLVNIAPDLSLAVRDAADREDWPRLRTLAARIRPFAALRAREPGYAVAVIKQAMAMQGQPGEGRVRPPISAMAPADMAELEHALAALTTPPLP